MSVAIWRIAIARPGVPAIDLSGAGAASAGGRWNSRGIAAVYTSASIALACLETLVHFNSAALPLKRFVVRIDVPDDVWVARKSLALADLPAGWDALPAAKALIEIGDRWLGQGATALLQVPSVIVPEEFDVVVNPRHPHASRLVATADRAWHYDGRLL